MKVATSALFGVLFGLGLLISGMLDPAKVLGFLDVAGDWNPQLAFVMGGAIAVALPAFQLARKRPQTLTGEPLQLPRRTGIDARLIGGAAIFGVGWGLAGLCPGPALVAVGFAGPSAFVFAGAMVLGALIARWTLKAPAPSSSEA
jgi:uncharacterized membrane protein YedE/YeeE